MYDRAHLTILGLCAGAGWGALAYLLGAAAFGPAVWPGVLTSPLIGALVARLTHPGFSRAAGLGRAFWPLASLYGGGILFSMPVAIGELVRRVGSGASPVAIATEPLLAVLWGITFTGLILILWPLAYLTHWVFEWRVH